MDNRLHEEIVRTVRKIVFVLDSEFRNELKATTERELSDFHFGLGVWIRNNILTNDSAVYRIFVENGIIEKDDMSAILIRELRCTLLGK